MNIGHTWDKKLDIFNHKSFSTKLSHLIKNREYAII